MTVFSAGGRARTFDFHAGDVDYVPRAMGHYIDNTGNEPLRYLELFNSAYYTDISLTNWMARTRMTLWDSTCTSIRRCLHDSRRARNPCVCIRKSKRSN